MERTYHLANASLQNIHEYGFTPESANGQTPFSCELEERSKEIALTAQVMSLQVIDSSEASLANVASKILVQGLFRHDCGC